MDNTFKSLDALEMFYQQYFISKANTTDNLLFNKEKNIHFLFAFQQEKPNESDYDLFLQGTFYLGKFDLQSFANFVKSSDAVKFNINDLIAAEFKSKIGKNLKAEFHVILNVIKLS